MHAQTVNPKDTLQQKRLITRCAFFLLFLLAPVLNIFRYDLTETRFILLGFPLSFNLNLDWVAQSTPAEVAGQILFWFVLPILVLVPLVLWIAFRWGRLYCGWLCPHFSVVETVNNLMRRASGKPSVWEKEPITPWKPDGTRIRPDARWWFVVLPAAVGFALLWAIALLTYLLPPDQVWGNVFRLEPTRNQAIFLTAATVVLSAEFLFARHLFCRYVCAVGLFQSLAWMGNRDAMVVGFKRERAADCATCLPDRSAACEAVCPMRLKPRNIKRLMFTCTQCAQCLQACATTQADNPDGPLLEWVSHEAARQNEAGFRSQWPHGSRE